MRLLVVRCLAFAVVQAETMARGNAGVNAGRSVVRAVLRNAPDISARNNDGALYVARYLMRIVERDDASA